MNKGIDWIVVAVIAGIVAIVISFFVGAWLWERRRRDTIRGIAEGLGLQFVEEPTYLLDGRFAGVNLFTLGRSQKCTNLVTGTIDGMLVAGFDYQYTIGAGKHQQTPKQTVAAFQVGPVGMPAFTMSVKYWYHRVGKWFGYKSVNFESHPKFSKAYLLRGPDEAAIREWFGPTLLEFMEQNLKWNIESTGATTLPGWLIIYKPGKRPKPNDLAVFLRETAQIGGVIAPPTS